MRGIRTVVVGCAAALDDGPLAALPNVAGVFGGTEPEPVLRSLSLPPVEGRKIQLVEPIKNVGEHTVSIKLDAGVVAEIKVAVTAAEAE